MPIYADKKDGKLTGRYRVEVQMDGRRLRGRYNSLPEAQEGEQALMERLRNGEAHQAPKRIDAHQGRPETLSEAIQKAEGRLWDGEAAVDGFRKLNAILGILGDLKLDRIGTSEVDDLIDALQRRELKDGTINRYLSAFSTFLKWCLAREYRTKALPTFAWREEGEGRIRWITFEEEALLMDLLPAPFDRLVRVAIETGMRRGELLSLTKEQVTPEWVHLWKTKNGEARTVPISAQSYADLTYLLAGNMPNEGELRRAWDRARRLMGLDGDEWFVFHACRHTCATRLVKAKVNLAVIKEYMGHKTIETTLRYAHVDSDSLREALQSALVYKAGISQGVALDVHPVDGVVGVETVGETASNDTQVDLAMAS